MARVAVIMWSNAGRWSCVNRIDIRRTLGQDVVAAYAAIEAQEKREHEAAFLSQPELSYTAVTRALAGNLVITVLKFGVYLRTGSAAMLSEAVHTLVDSGNQAILLFRFSQFNGSSLNLVS